MSTDSVEAGRTYVKLSIKDRVGRGLKRAKERLADWTHGLAVVGTEITAKGLIRQPARNAFSKLALD